MNRRTRAFQITQALKLFSVQLFGIKKNPKQTTP